MKRGLSAALALALFLAVSPLAQAAAFPDIQDTDWYAPAAAYVQVKGWMNGMGDGSFQPQGTMTRGMLATVLHRAAGSPLSTAGLYFEDIYAGTWYADAVVWCGDAGIVTGTDSLHFSPEHPVTREQVALMLWRLAGWPPPSRTAIFVDGAQINTWSRAGVDWACQAGIVTGKSDGTFDPQGWATRAEVAQMLMKYGQWKTAQQTG